MYWDDLYLFLAGAAIGLLWLINNKLAVIRDVACVLHLTLAKKQLHDLTDEMFIKEYNRRFSSIRENK